MTYGKNLWRLFKSMPVILSLFVLLQMASLFAFLFVYENAHKQSSNNVMYQKETCSYSIQFGEGVSFSAISERVDAFPDKEYYGKNLILSDDGYLVAVYGESDHGLQLGKDATAPNEIVLDKIALTQLKCQVGEKVSLYNKEYVVTGCYFRMPDDQPFYKVSPSSIQPDDEITAFELQLKEYPSTKEKNAFLSRLEETFPEAVVRGPQDRNLNFEYGFDYMVLISILAVLLVLVNISFLYTFFLEKRKRTFCAYRLCGCGKTRLFYMLLCELLTMVLLCVIVTALLWTCVFHPILFPEWKLEIARLLIPVGCYFLCVLLVFVPKFKDFTDMSVVSLMKQIKT